MINVCDILRWNGDDFLVEKTYFNGGVVYLSVRHKGITYDVAGIRVINGIKNGNIIVIKKSINPRKHIKEHTMT